MSNSSAAVTIKNSNGHHHQQQSSTVVDQHQQITIPSARPKIPPSNPVTGSHKKTLSSPPRQSNSPSPINSSSSTTTTNPNNTIMNNGGGDDHSQPITINSSSSSKNNSRKNNNKSSFGSFKKMMNHDQVLSREFADQQLNQSSSNNNDNINNIIIDNNNSRSRAKSLSNSSNSNSNLQQVFTPKQVLSLKSPNKKQQQLNHSKSIPNSLNDKADDQSFEVSKSTTKNFMINTTTNNNNNNYNNTSPTKGVKIMTPTLPSYQQQQQRKKKQFGVIVDDSNNYSSSAPSKYSLTKFDNTTSIDLEELSAENSEILDEVLEDLIARFVLNCPTLDEEQMEGIDSHEFETLFFQLEEAFWFYYDFHRPKYKTLPKYKFSKFCEKVFDRCPSLLESLITTTPQESQVDILVQRFLDYKTSVPVYGCIILNENMDKVLLVQGYNTKSWSFPKGKINQNEKESTCAAREVYEECGYELGDRVSEQDFIEIEQNYESTSVPDYKDKYKHSNPYTKLFIVGGIPESTNFVTRTRKEILKIKWFSIDYLYETCYPRSKDKQGLRTWLVKPFLNSLIDWIKKKRQQPTIIVKATATGTIQKTPEKKKPPPPNSVSSSVVVVGGGSVVNRSNRSLTAPSVAPIQVLTKNLSSVSTNLAAATAGSPLLSFVFDTEEILEKK